MKINIPRRLKAFSIHFSFSAAAFFVVLYFILAHWYPKPHFTVNGGWQGVRIMLFVDFVLGPFLTLLLFRPLKSFRALAFDMTCIVIMQISAFAWGVYAVHSQRPVGLSLSDGTIYPILEGELRAQEKSPEDLKTLDEGRPPVMFSRAAETEEEQVGVVSYEFVEGIPKVALVFLLDPIKNHINELFAASLDNIQDVPENFIPIRDAYLARHKYQTGELAFVPFAGRYGNTLLVFNHSGKIIDSIPDPRYNN